MAASAIARSWIASPVESNVVISSSSRGPAASPASTSPSWVTRSRSSLPASTAWTSSPLWLACSQSSAKILVRRSSADCDLSFPGPVGAHQAHVLARLERALGEQHLVAGRHRHEQVGRERLVTRRHAGADLLGCLLAPARRRRRTGRRRGPGRGTSSRSDAVHAGADDGRGLRVRAAERLRREHGGRSGPERRDGARVEHRAQCPVRGVREQDEPHHGRQPLRRVSGKGGDPLQATHGRRPAPASRGSPPPGTRGRRPSAASTTRRGSTRRTPREPPRAPAPARRRRSTSLAEKNGTRLKRS